MNRKLFPGLSPRSSPGPVTWAPIELGLGKVLAQDVIGAVDSPPFDNSSMDGYAVRAAEAKTGATIRVSAEEQAAGPDLGLSLREGEAIRIFTGAPMPDGADAVIMQEDVNRDGDVIEILEGVESGEFHSPAGRRRLRWSAALVARG